MNGYEYQDVFTNGSGSATTRPSTLTVIVPAAAQFSVGSETVNEAAGTFSVPVTLTGTVATTPTVSTFASGFSAPQDVAFDAAGNLYVTNYSAGTVSKVTSAGVVSTFASGITHPIGLAFDATGNLYVSNSGNTVSKVTPGGVVSTFASGFSNPKYMTFDPAGNLYVGDQGSSGSNPNSVSKVTPAGVVTTFASGFSSPEGLAFDAAGNLYVASYNTNRISKVTPSGVVSTFASNLSGPFGLTFDAYGNLYVANTTGNTVNKVTPGGVVSTFASGFFGPAGVALDAAGNLYVANASHNTVSEVTEIPDTVTVPFTLGGTAVSGADYSGIAPRPLTFAPGQTTQNISGTLLSDPGPSQTLVINLGTPTNAILGSPAVNTLTINEPLVAPVVSTNPSAATINAGGNTSFVSAATAYPTPTEQWQISTDGGATFTNLTDGGVYSGTTTGTLSITDGTIAMNGYEYQDVFTNSSGSATTDPSTLTVDVAPTVVTNPNSATINAGHNASFTVAANGNPTPTVQWQVSADGGATFTDLTNTGIYSGVTTDTLSLDDADATQNGYEYQAVFTNTLFGAGSPSTATTTPATLTVNTTITLPVTNMTDSHVDGELSLREALAIVSSANGNYIINVPAGTIDLTQGILSTDDPGYNVAINGVGPGPTVVDAQGASAVMQVTSGTTSDITNFEFTGGNDPNNDGYGGGGIQNAGTLTLNSCTVDSNSDTDGGEGGGIGNLGTLTITNSAITGNSTDGDGGAIYNDGGTLTVINSTLANNSAGYDDGGGITNVGGACTITDATVDGNQGGGVFNISGGTLLLQGSIVADSTGRGPDLYGPATGSYDLIGDGSDSGSGLANLVAGQPMLSLLGNYGGSTQTMAPLPGSPAIAGGSTFADANGLDQRGIERSLETPTIGAFESQGFVVTTTNGSGTQSELVGSPFSDLQIHVTSNDPGVPLTGAVITFSAPQSGASATLGAATATLDVNGNAQVSASANITPGSYSVTASAGAAPSTDGVFSLTNSPAVAPTVTTNPTNDTINSGRNASFTAVATGNLAPTQQWQVSTDGGATFVNITDGGVYSGSTTGTLSITDGTAEMNGYQYQDVFTNGSGSATTVPSTLTVDFAPTVTTNPTNDTVNAGSNAYFTVAATGSPTPTVQWQMSTDGGVTFDNLINLGRDSGVTTDTLTINGAPLAANGFEFRAVFSDTLLDAGGPTAATTTAATLTVNAAPAVHVNPSSVTINAGSDASFTSTATGNPTPTSQWQVSADGGTTFNNITNGGVYGGATTGTLSITDGTAAMNGYEYRDIFTNGIGSATTDPSTLTVDFAPSVTINPTSTTIDTGSDASFTVAATGNPTPTVQWQVSTDGGGTFNNLTDTGIYSGSSTDTLTLTGATLAETGYEYQAVFSNTLHDAADPSIATTTPATLNVDIAPVVSASPTSVTINAGSNASFTSSATGTPAPTDQWQVSTDGGETFNNITDGGIYSGATTGTLSITGGTAGMNGYEYRTIFTNGGGTAATDPSTLTVNFVPPTIVNPLIPMTASGKSVGLKILGSDPASGTDAGMTYSWSLIRAPAGAKTPVFTANGTHAAKQTSVAFSKAGTYHLQCVATDTEGQSVTTSQLITISQVATSLRLSPHALVQHTGTQQQYSGVVLDQFKHALRVQPTLSFSVKSGVGSITSAGLFNAGSQIGHTIIEADTTDMSGVLGTTIV
jgi:hypothetical protein